MSVETDQFITATQALWAGDFKYAEQLLQRNTRFGYISKEDESRSPEELIVSVSGLRLRQLWHRRGEFSKISEANKTLGVVLSPEPYILEGAQLRATLWRDGWREWLMQGFLTDLAWQKELFRRAPSAVAKLGGEIEPTAATDHGRGAPIGASWIVPGDPFLQCDLTDLGLLEVRGYWTGKKLPETVAELTAPFRAVLSAFEDPLAGQRPQAKD